MDEAVRELIHRTIDHEADAADQERLREILAADAAARAEWEEMNALARTLAQVGLVEPPPGWRAELLGRLQPLQSTAQHAAIRPASRSRVEDAVVSLRRRFSVRTAFVFAAGAAAGIVVSVGLSLGPRLLDEGSAPGALLPSNRMRQNLGPQGERPVGEFRADLAGGSVVIRSSARGSLSRIAIEADSGGPLGLELDFDPGSLRVRGIEQEAPEGAAIAVDAGQVRIEQHAPNRYWLWLEEGQPGSVEIRIRVRSPGGIREGSLPALPAGT